MPTQSEVVKHFTDFVPERLELWCYGFRLDAFAEEYYTQPVYAALLDALRELSESSKLMREQAFTIWAGDHALHFWVGVPRQVTAETIETLRTHLAEVAAYETLESGKLPNVGLLPRFRYERGTVVQYVEDELAGRTRHDGEQWYGSGLELQLRTVLPASLNGGEVCYGGLLSA